MADIKADIQEAQDNFVRAFNAKDFEAMTKLYVDDCRIMAPGTPVKFGKDALVAAIHDMFKIGVDRMTVIIEDYGGSADQAWRRGFCTTYTKDNKIFSVIKDAAILKRVGGKLLFFIDMWNFDSPH